MFAFVLWAWQDLSNPQPSTVATGGTTTVLSFTRTRVQPAYYGPASYYSLGRVHPRNRVREMYPLVRRRLNPANPITAPVIPSGLNFSRLLREDWRGPEGQARLGQEIYALVQQIPSLAPFSSRVAAITWRDLQVSSQQLADIFQATGLTAFRSRVPRLLRLAWVSGKTFSEELYTLFNSMR